MFSRTNYFCSRTNCLLMRIVWSNYLSELFGRTIFSVEFCRDLTVPCGANQFN